MEKSDANRSRSMNCEGQVLGGFDRRTGLSVEEIATVGLMASLAMTKGGKPGVGRTSRRDAEGFFVAALRLCARENRCPSVV